MASNPNDDLDPHRIARSTRNDTGSSQRARVARIGGRGARRVVQQGLGTSVSKTLPQRAVVKVRIVRHRTPGKGRGALLAHVSYLSREAVRGANSGRFYDAKQDELNAKQETKSWRADRHHFRIILSAEEAESLADLRSYTREVMRRIERDLGPIQWIAVDHRNTKNPHTHLLFRGRTLNGKDLVIPREYISFGIRRRAAEVATEWLGMRAREQAQSALASEVRAERYTSLDRTLERFARRTGDDIKIDLQKAKISRFALTTREMLAARLEFVAQLGLAERTAKKPGVFRGQTRAWQLSPEFKTKLRELGERNDIIKQLYASMGQRAARVAPQIQRMSAKPAGKGSGSASVKGVLIAKGALDESSDERFVVVEDHSGKPHYARVWSNSAIEATQIGGVIEIGSDTRRRHGLNQEVIAVARSQEKSQYSTSVHRQWLRQNRTEYTPEQIERRLRRFAKSVARLARKKESGVSRAADRCVQINGDLLERFTVRNSRWLDVRVIATHSLKSQITAEAYTWLDRQIIRERLSEKSPPNDITRMRAVRDAMTQRADWLVQHDFAERDPEAKDKEAIRFHRGATNQLKVLEHKEFANRCHERHGKSVSFLRRGEMLRGIYRGTVYLHRGSFALVAKKDHLFAAPVSREPRYDKGIRVEARVVSRTHTKFELSGSKNPLKSIGMDR